MDLNKLDRPFITGRSWLLRRKSSLTRHLLSKMILGALTVFLVNACGQDQESALKRLRDQGIAYNQASFVERAGNGDAQTVKLFLQAGMDVNARDAKGRTPLRAAAAAGHTDVVKSLLEHNAAVNAIYLNITPVMAASKNGNTSVEKLLAAKGGKSRFTVSPAGIISDSLLKVEWFVGPDRDISWEQARVWASGLQVAGEGWRLPTPQ